MAIFTYPEHLQINPTGRLNLSLVGFTVRFIPSGHLTIGDMNVLRRNVDVAKQMLVHIVVVTLLVLGGQTQVLVQVECSDFREIETVLRVKANQLVVHTDWRASGCETKHQRGLRPHGGGYYSCRFLADLPRVSPNNHQHKRFFVGGVSSSVSNAR